MSTSWASSLAPVTLEFTPTCWAVSDVGTQPLLRSGYMDSAAFGTQEIPENPTLSPLESPFLSMIAFDLYNGP